MFAELDWDEVQGAVKKLNKQMNLKLESKGTMKKGDNIFVDYICLRDVLDFIAESKRDFDMLVKIQVILDS